MNGSSWIYACYSADENFREAGDVLGQEKGITFPVCSAADEICPE